MAQLAASEHLTAAITNVMPDVVTHLQQSPSWGAGVAAWRRASALNPRGATRVLEGALRHPGDAEDHMAVIHARLRTIAGKGSSGQLDALSEELTTTRPDLHEMINQVRSRTASRRTQVAREALTGMPPWVRSLRATAGDDIDAQRWAAVVSDIAAYRDRWDIETPADPLGPVPANFEWEQTQDHDRLQRLIQSMLTSPLGLMEKGEPAMRAPIVHKPLIDVGPSL